MANLFSSFLERQLNPIVQTRAEAILKDNRGYIAGTVQAAPVTLRDSIGAPTDTDHALLYAIYRMHVDVNACVNKWMSGVTGGGWRIVHADPGIQPDDAFTKQLDETQMWLRNPNPFKPFGLIIQEVVQHLAISGDAFLYASRQGDRESGRILELWPLNPSTMTIVASDRGEVVGYVQKVNGKRAEFEPWQILHFRLANPFNWPIPSTTCMASRRWLPPWRMWGSTCRRCGATGRSSLTGSSPRCSSPSIPRLPRRLSSKRLSWR